MFKFGAGYKSGYILTTRKREIRVQGTANFRAGSGEFACLEVEAGNPIIFHSSLGRIKISPDEEVAVWGLLEHEDHEEDYLVGVYRFESGQWTKVR